MNFSFYAFIGPFCCLLDYVVLPRLRVGSQRYIAASVIEEPKTRAR